MEDIRAKYWMVLLLGLVVLISVGGYFVYAYDNFVFSVVFGIVWVLWTLRLALLLEESVCRKCGLRIGGRQGDVSV